jgi:hypothetical protein
VPLAQVEPLVMQQVLFQIMPAGQVEVITTHR